MHAGLPTLPEKLLPSSLTHPCGRYWLFPLPSLHGSVTAYLLHRNVPHSSETYPLLIRVCSRPHLFLRTWKLLFLCVLQRNREFGGAPNIAGRAIERGCLRRCLNLSKVPPPPPSLCSSSTQRGLATPLNQRCSSTNICDFVPESSSSIVRCNDPD